VEITDLRFSCFGGRGLEQRVARTNNVTCSCTSTLKHIHQLDNAWSLAVAVKRDLLEKPFAWAFSGDLPRIVVILTIHIHKKCFLFAI
jgi:hypothetical protein